MNAPATSTWHLVVPVKDHREGKSRLHPPRGVRRSDLALAIAVDTVTAARQVVPGGHLILVTSDAELVALVAGSGVRLVPDPGRGLNAAICAGVRVIERPGTAAVLLGDLPALTPGELDAGLCACAAAESAFVPDFEGTGTVLLTHHDAARLKPRFGSGSAARHARSATRLDLALPRLRTDVDTDAALRIAVELGVGPATQGLLTGQAPAHSTLGQ